MNALLEIVGRVDPRAAALLRGPAAPKTGWLGAPLSVHPLLLLWASVASAAVLAVFTAPRLEAWRAGLDARPFDGPLVAAFLLAACVLVAVGFTWAELQQPRAPFGERLRDALREGRDGPAAVATAVGFEGPVLADGAVTPQLSRALRGQLGPVFAAAVCALLESGAGVERGLEMLARGVVDRRSGRLLAVERMAAVAMTTATVVTTYLMYVRGMSA